MPPTRGQGQSDITPKKEDQFRRIVGQHLKIVEAAYRKAQYQPYVYIDATAGSGYNFDAGCPGSPAIFIEEVCKTTVGYRAHLIDADRDAVSHLRERFGDNPNVVVHHGDNREIVPEIVGALRGAPYGLLYFDPNGFKTKGIPVFDTVEAACESPTMNRIDALLRVNTTVIKRFNSSTGGGRRFDACVKKIGKKNWLVSPPEKSDGWGWSFSLGMNAGREMSFKWCGLHRMESARGEGIVHGLSYTKAERAHCTVPQKSLSEFFGGVPA